jgi:hypothetical protein
LPGEIPYQPRDGEGKLGLGSSALDGAKFAPTPQRPSLANLPGRARPGGPGGAADFPLASPLGELGGSLDKANRDYTRQTFIEVIVGDEAELQKRLRWFAAAKRPAIGLRWGLGIQGVGQARLSSGMAAEFELSRITGPIGPAILEGLQQRVADGQFGQWSKPRSIRVTPVALLGSGNQRELLRSAERCGVHALLLCDLATKTVGLSKKTDMVMKVQLLDVATQQAMWTSKPLSSRAVGRGPGSSAAEQFVADVLAKVDEQFALKPMPAIKPEHVQRRLATLRDETAKSPDPLTLLAELRYYQTKQLATAEDLLPLYDAVLGAGKGQTFSGGSAQQRRTVLQAVGE